MSSGFLKALGVLAKSPSLNRYLNILKPAEEGVSKGMDYFNNAVKKVVDEGDEIEKTLDTKKYVHPDRPDIFVEIDVNTGNVNVGLLDEEAGAFAYSDLELDPRSADVQEKAKLMKEMGKSKGKGKRARMIEIANRILRDKKVDGGRVGMFMGGSLPKGAGLLRQMIKMAAKEKGLEKPSEMLSRFNPKKADRLLDDPNIFLKADIEEGIMATDKIKDFKNTAQSVRVDIVSYLLKMAKDLRRMNLTTREQTNAMIEAAVKMGMDRKQAEFLSKGLAKAAETGAGFPRNAPEPTERGILELETILKNLKTGGKSPRSLNADGGYVGLKDGGEVSLTVIEIPDISGSGVETLFKKR
jgi:hypothetical protein